MLENLEFVTDGKLLGRTNRLYSRPQGDYEEEDFVQTVDTSSREGRTRRDQLCMTFIQYDALLTRLRDDFVEIVLKDSVSTRHHPRNSNGQREPSN